MVGLALIERARRLQRGELVTMAAPFVDPGPRRFDEGVGDVELADVTEPGCFEQLALRQT